MAYSNSWDESAPAGSAAANTLDTIIQSLKLDIRERLQDPFPDWTDDSVDPKRVVCHAGVAASRPSTGDANTGEFYFATDDLTLDVFDGSDWQTVSANVLVDTFANRPSAGAVAEGTLFWATDTKVLYIQASSTWETVTADVAVDVALMDAELNISLSSSATKTIPITPIADYDTADWIIEQMRMRFREASAPGSFGNWIYYGAARASSDFDFSVVGAGNGSISLGYWTCVTSSAFPEFDNVLEFVNSSSDQAEDIDIQIQAVLRALPSALDQDPSFSL